ncbi:hypothetical protein GGD64_005538 [Bradyrhizobium sp. CIR3A]|nr:hypothetical protein [Bradyrhizobium sp. CIR3A]NYG46487.1 hypothetical protein [Bradyrhizobium sp. IAR9]
MTPVRSRLRADERRFKRTAKSRGPGCRCYSQALRRCAEPDRAKRAAIREVTEASRNSSPGRARHRPSNIAQGRPDVSASPVDPLCIACASHRTTDPRVPAGARPSLRPFVEGAMRSAKLGRKCREEVKACLQHTTGVVGWAKRLVRHSSKSDGGSVPTHLVPRLNLVGTARCAFAYPTAPCLPHTLGVIARAGASGIREGVRAPSPRMWRDRIGSTKNPLSTVRRSTLMNQPRLVHKRRPVAGGSPPRCVLG